MSFAQTVARFLLAVVTLVLVIASVIIATDPTGHGRAPWHSAAILLWAAVGLLFVNLGLGEITVKRGRT